MIHENRLGHNNIMSIQKLFNGHRNIQECLFCAFCQALLYIRLLKFSTIAQKSSYIFPNNPYFEIVCSFQQRNNRNIQTCFKSRYTKPQLSVSKIIPQARKLVAY